MSISEPLRPTSGASDSILDAELRQTRARTLALSDSLDPSQLIGPRLPIVNPFQWEIGHIAWFHEYWTLRHAHGQRPILERGDSLWDSSNVAHTTRWNLELPNRRDTFAYMQEVLERQRQRLAAGLAEPARYFYELAIRHEDMHVEALTYMHQTLGFEAPTGLGGGPGPRAGGLAGDAEIPAGSWRLGSKPDEGFIWDNEKWAHPVELQRFRIARAPVSNAQYADFIEDGGYRRRELWCEAGWRWRETCGAQRPVYWRPKQDGVWLTRRYRQLAEIEPDAPVVFVTWFEAEAWCRWAGRRLPSEAEWEAAALGEPDAKGTRLADSRRRWPWGSQPPTPAHANLDFSCDAPIDVAACAGGDSAFGCRQMIGNVWEWTASDFQPFDGFEADPYRDYSQPWFGSRKVLRGGCWASSARIARAAYRNFFPPDRNDVFAGFRTCAL